VPPTTACSDRCRHVLFAKAARAVLSRRVMPVYLSSVVAVDAVNRRWVWISGGMPSRRCQWHGLRRDGVFARRYPPQSQQRSLIASL